RIILDHHLRTPLDAKVVTDHCAKTWIITGSDVSKEKQNPYLKKGIRIISLYEKQIKIHPLLKLLGNEGITTLFVEGGATINDRILQAKAVNQVISYIAPILIGGKNAPTSFAGEGTEDLANAFSLTFDKVEKIGNDLKIVSYPKGN